MRSFLIAALAINLGASFASAQSFYAVRRERSLILVAGTGTSTYFGELSNNGDYLDAKPNVNVGLQYFVNNHISVRGEATWFTLKGSDALANSESRKRRNLSFSSNNLELSLTSAVNLFPNGTRYYRRPGFNVYGFGGIGVMYYHPTTIYQGKKYALRPLHTELVNYSGIGLVIPFGLGVRLKVNPNFNITFEGGYRKTFTDYLDDVSTVHHDASKFSNPIAAALSDRRPELGRPAVADGTQRGNPNNKDGYFLLNAKLEYYLPFDFQSNRSRMKSYNKGRNSMYRYNKKGGFKQKRRR